MGFMDRAVWNMKRSYRLAVILGQVILTLVLALVAAWFLAWTATYLLLTSFSVLDFSDYFRGLVGHWPTSEDAGPISGVIIIFLIPLAFGFLAWALLRLNSKFSPP